MRHALPRPCPPPAAVLLKAEAVWALVRCLTAWPEAEAVVLPMLRLLPRLLGASREHQGAFRRAGGVAAVQGVMEKHEGALRVVEVGRG